MGKITEELITLIKKQVQDHGLVVWYDPERVYTDLVSRLELPETTILQFEGSFFELRHRMEPFLEFVDENGHFHADVGIPPRLLVYVPLDRATTQHALIEAETAGVVMQPGASPWQRNTRLKVLAERIFKQIAPDRASSIARDVEAGRITLEELDWLADQTGDVGTVKLIFGTTAAVDVALSFLSSDEHDESIAKKHALPELTSLFRSELGLEINPDQPIGQVREAFCQSLLLAELALKAGAGEKIPEKLAAIPVPTVARQREQLLAVCHEWRNRLDLRETYADSANRVQRTAQVIGLGLNAQEMIEVQTFSCIEALLLDWTEAQILEGKTSDILELVSHRKSSFWSLYEAEYQLRWTLLEIATRLLLTADSIEADLKLVNSDIAAMIKAYTEGVRSENSESAIPWHMLDRHHRHLEYRYAMLDFRVDGEHAQLEKVIERVRERYSEVVEKCAEHFAKAFQTTKFTIKDILCQHDIFPKKVRSCVTESKTAYILVDALRYEMGLELIEGLGDEFEINMSPGLAQLPTITEVGMAALVRGADDSMELVDVGGGRVGIRIGSALLKDRTSRIKHFKTMTKSSCPLVLKLNDLMKPTKKRREAIAEADLILVTSQEIDRRGEETEDEEEARRFMDEVLEKLRRGIRRLAALGVQHIVVTADHGYLFVERLDEDMKVDPPGGHTVDLHPRVWIGHGGSDLPGCLRVTANQIGLTGDLEIVFPTGLACFRTRGSTRGYFHGGLSLQELLIPVAAISVLEARTGDLATATVTLKLAKPKITTRFFSIEACYIVGGLFGNDTKRIKVVARADRSEVVGTAAMAAYGFEEGTQEILLEKNRPNAITMMLTADFDSPSVSVHVLDATTQVELAAMKNIPVELSI